MKRTVEVQRVGRRWVGVVREADIYTHSHSILGIVKAVHEALLLCGAEDEQGDDIDVEVRCLAPELVSLDAARAAERDALQNAVYTLRATGTPWTDIARLTGASPARCRAAVDNNGGAR